MSTFDLIYGVPLAVFACLVAVVPYWRMNLARLTARARARTGCACPDCIGQRPASAHSHPTCQCQPCVAASQAQHDQDKAARARLEDWLRQQTQRGQDRPSSASSSHGNRQAGDTGKAAAYALLGLKPGANRNEITAAWRREAFKYHPDRNPGGAQRMRALNNARDLLLGR